MHGKRRRQAFFYLVSAALLLTMGLYTMGTNHQTVDAAPFPLTQSILDPRLEIGALAKIPARLVPQPVSIPDPQTPQKTETSGTDEGRPAAVRYITTACYLNVRADPNNKSQILSVVEQGTALDVADKTDNGWLKLAGGGYIHGGYAKPAEPLKENRPKPQPESGTLAFSAEPGKPTSKINSDSGLSEGHIGALLDGTALEGQDLEPVILEIEDKLGINAYFTVAVMKLESGNGKSRLAKHKNNLFGLNASGADAYRRASQFDTKADSVRTFGMIISKNYVGKGYTTVEKVAGKYCPANSKWPTLVKNIMKSDHNLL